MGKLKTLLKAAFCNKIGLDYSYDFYIKDGEFYIKPENSDYPNFVEKIEILLEDVLEARIKAKEQIYDNGGDPEYFDAKRWLLNWLNKNYIDKKFKAIEKTKEIENKLVFVSYNAAEQTYILDLFYDMKDVNQRIKNGEIDIRYDADYNILLIIDNNPYNKMLKYKQIIYIPTEEQDKWYEAKTLKDNKVLYRVGFGTLNNVLSCTIKDACKEISDEKIEQVKQQIFNVINQYKDVKINR